MASYASLTSLLLSLDNIPDHNLALCFHPQQLQSLREKLTSLLHSLQNCGNHETKLRDVAFRAEDLIAAASCRLDPDFTSGVLYWISYSGNGPLLFAFLSAMITAVGSWDVTFVFTLLLLSLTVILFPELHHDPVTSMLRVLVLSVCIVSFPETSILKVLLLSVAIICCLELRALLIVSVLSVAVVWFLELHSVLTGLLASVIVVWFLELCWGVNSMITASVLSFGMIWLFDLRSMLIVLALSVGVIWSPELHKGVIASVRVLVLSVCIVLFPESYMFTVMVLSVGIVWYLDLGSTLNVLVLFVGIVWFLELRSMLVVLVLSVSVDGFLNLHWGVTSMLSVSVVSVGLIWFFELRSRLTVLVVSIGIVRFMGFPFMLLFKKMMHQLLRNWRLNQIFKEINFIAESIEGAKDVQLPSTPVSSSSRYSRINNIGKNVVVGMGRDLEMMKTRLGYGSSALQLVPVVGMGGIGKTTLATMVYKDHYIRDRFDVRAWATVSEEYSFCGAVQDLLNSAGLTKLEEEGADEELGNHLRKSLYGRRYLIVLDDVWDVKVLDDMRRFLPDNNNGSCALMTTRSSKVAHYANPCTAQHEMKFLIEHDSRKLLHSHVFGEEDCPDELREVQDEIAQSCKGLPLALLVISGLLSKIDRTRESWKSFMTSLKLASSKDNDEYEHMEVLALSYKHLPHNLRPCFLYMGMFPEDYKVSANKLSQLWAAEGFLRSNSSKSPEELAEEYLKELVERNMILVNSRSSQNRIKTCKIHDVLRKLCLREAQKEKFLCVINHQSNVSKRGVKFYRRLSFHPNNLSAHPYIAWDEKLYSLMYIRSARLFPRFANFYYRVLRVLDLLTFRIHQFPPEIYGLICLRYLALCFRGRLHADIARLRNLQTIVFLGSPSLGYYDTLPVEIWMIPNLRHLHVLEIHLPTPPNGSSSLSLLTLVDVKNMNFDIQVVDRIKSLKKLYVSYDVVSTFSMGLSKYKLENLACLNHLEKLRLKVNNVYRCTDYPQNLAFPQSLKNLTLEGCMIPWECVSIVGALSNLEVLKLRDRACQGAEWEPMVEQFCALKLLEFRNLDVMKWKADESHFPCLQSLIVISCDRLEEIPSGIGDITSLERIVVFNCQPGVENSAKQIREDQEEFTGSSELQVSVSRGYKFNKDHLQRS